MRGRLFYARVKREIKQGRVREIRFDAQEGYCEVQHDDEDQGAKTIQPQAGFYDEPLEPQKIEADHSDCVDDRAMFPEADGDQPIRDERPDRNQGKNQP